MGDSDKAANVNSFGYVRFDVGHYLYVCHRDTILKCDNSVLAKYISPSFDRRKSEMDYIVIDRDGKQFGAILNYLRDACSLDLTNWSDADIIDLKKEADFYCLESLMEICDSELDAREELHLVEQMKGFSPFSSQYLVPEDQKLEIIFGEQTIIRYLESANRPVIIVSYRSMYRFHIETWFEELIKLCDYNRFKVCGYSSSSTDESSVSASLAPPVASLPLADYHPNMEYKQGLNDFLISVFEPTKRTFSLILRAPDKEKFRKKRSLYKVKIFKCWLQIQNNKL